MQIYVNGTPRAVSSDLKVAELVVQEQLTGKRIAIEVNEELIPRSRFDAHTLAEGDRVEIVAAIGGG